MTIYYGYSVGTDALAISTNPTLPVPGLQFLFADVADTFAKSPTDALLLGEPLTYKTGAGDDIIQIGTLLFNGFFGPGGYSTLQNSGDFSGTTATGLDMGAGNDVLDVNLLVVSNYNESDPPNDYLDVTITMGDGNDTVKVKKLEFTQSTELILGGTNLVDGVLVIDTGIGNDTVRIDDFAITKASSVVRAALDILTGAGNDSVKLGTNAHLLTGMSVDMGAGADLLTLQSWCNLAIVNGGSGQESDGLILPAGGKANQDPLTGYTFTVIADGFTITNIKDGNMLTAKNFEYFVFGSAVYSSAQLADYINNPSTPPAPSGTIPSISNQGTQGTTTSQGATGPSGGTNTNTSAQPVAGGTNNTSGTGSPTPTTFIAVEPTVGTIDAYLPSSFGTQLLAANTFGGDPIFYETVI